MAVLERPLQQVHPEVDLVTTPAGDPVAMVHCNNGASELNAWAGLFGEFAKRLGSDADQNAVFETLFAASLEGDLLVAALELDPLDVGEVRLQRRQERSSIDRRGVTAASRQHEPGGADQDDRADDDAT